MYKRNIGAHSRNGCYCGKTISITQAECVCVCVCVALFIQHAKRMRCVILPFVVRLALPHFSTFPHKRHHFRAYVTEHKVYIVHSPTNALFIKLGKV